MKIIADINIGVSIVEGLRNLGHDISRSSAHLAATATDAEVAGLAARERAVVLTRDQDFSMLLALSRASAPSVLNLRHRSTSAQLLISVVDAVVRRHEPELTRGALITIDERGVRLHALPIGSSD